MELGFINKDNYQLVATIYQEGIETGIATFETNVPSWEKWDQSHLLFGRITARENGKVLGWAALSSVSSRCVYGGVAEVSVYVNKDSRNKGVGKWLLSHLIEISEQNNIWTLQSGIFPNNKSSIRIHEQCGFRTIGYKEKIGKLHNIWHDNVIMERRSKKVGV